MMRDLVNKVAGNILPKQTIEDKLKAKTVISSKMVNAIKLWTAMYLDEPPWKGEKGLETKTSNIPASIAREFARLITQESEIKVGGDARGEYINTQLQRFLKYFPAKVELYCAKGGIAIKPYISDNNVILSLYTADRFYPTAYDTNGDISGAVFIEQIRKGEYVYTRLEWHTMNYNAKPEPEEGEDADVPKGNSNIYNVVNQAYRSERLTSYSGDTEFDLLNCRSPLQDAVPLNSVNEWADIEPEVNIEGLDAPLFVYIKVPSANNVDTYSPLGVSVYSLAVDAIREADRQYTRCIYEYELKEAAIHASSDLWKKNRDGTDILPEGRERLYRTLDDDGEKPMLQDYSPTIRDASFFKGLEEKKRDIEFLVGLAYGSLSNPNTVSKTAEEIKTSKQRSFTTVQTMQTELQDGFERVCYVVDALADLYDLAPAGKYELTCTWGDSVLEDSDKEYQRRLQMAMSGMIRKESFVAWYFGCTEQEALSKYMPGTNPIHEGNDDKEEDDNGQDGGA